MRIHRTRVQYIHKIHPEAFRIGLAADGVSRDAKPGQFYMVHTGCGLDPLLPRPFAIHRRYLTDGDTPQMGEGLELLFQVVGKGTRLLAQKRSGDWVDVWGPLGNGWDPDPQMDPILVGGGIGVAALLPLIEELPKKQQRRGQIFLGARTPGRLWCIQDMKRLGIVVHTAAEEGDHPFKGTVLDLIQAHWEAIASRPSQLFVCGPSLMVKAVTQWSLAQRVPCQVSLEAPMACGVGVCLGCVVKKQRDEGYLRVCKEGPIFDGADIDWGAFHGG